MMQDHEWLRVHSCSSRKRYPINSPVHTHEGYDFFYTVSGVAYFLLEDDNGQLRKHELHPGEFVLIKASIPHRLRIGETDQCHMILMNLRTYEPENKAFSFRWLKQAHPEAAALFENPRLVLKCRDHNNQLCAQLTLLLQAVQMYQRNPDGKDIIHLLLTASLIEMTCLNKLASKNDYQSHYINSAVGYIEQHYYNPFKVSDVAEYIGIHPAYLQRLFHQKTGTTILAYTNALRVSSAKRQLECTSYSIQDIALECGFANRQNFGRVFRQAAGMSPDHYRKKLRRNKESNFLLQTDTQEDGKL